MLNWFIRSLGEESNRVLVYKKSKKDTTNFTVRLFNGEILTKFDSIADEAGYTRNEMVNIIMEKFVNEAEIISAEENQEKTQNNFRSLEKHLFATIGRDVLIALTNEELGRETKRYILIDYKLSYEEKSLYLELGRNGDRYPISFRKIYDLRCTYEGDGLKTYLFMEDKSWHFYLDFDGDKLNNLQR